MRHKFFRGVLVALALVVGVLGAWSPAKAGGNSALRAEVVLVHNDTAVGNLRTRFKLELVGHDNWGNPVIVTRKARLRLNQAATFNVQLNQEKFGSDVEFTALLWRRDIVSRQWILISTDTITMSRGVTVTTLITTMASGAPGPGPGPSPGGYPNGAVVVVNHLQGKVLQKVSYNGAEYSYPNVPMGSWAYEFFPQWTGAMITITATFADAGNTSTGVITRTGSVIGPPASGPAAIWDITNSGKTALPVVAGEGYRGTRID